MTDAAVAGEARSRRTTALALLTVVLLVLAGFLLLRLQPAASNEITPSPRSPVASPAPLAVAPADSYSLPPLALPASTAAIAPDPEALKALEERLITVESRIDALGPRLGSVEHTLDSANEALGGITAQLATLLARVPEPHKAAPRKVVRRAPPKPRRLTLPEIVAIDRWGDADNATLRNADGSIRFVRVGDTVGKATIAAIDASAAAVTVRLPDGKSTTLKVTP
ncbi:MAG: hypothetical protein KDG52_21680 [Rhodocyclaceae bacterium]|nr:hypothetical protein [Rhodocyclaceae bacterium]